MLATDPNYLQTNKKLKEEADMLFPEVEEIDEFDMMYNDQQIAYRLKYIALFLRVGE